ncbi:DUF6894 family protein [Methylobacterium sp. CM6247]
MPRYHFNVYDGKSTLDQEGTELNSIEEARFAAVCLAGRIILENFKHICSSDEWRLEVADENGLLLIWLDFTMIESPIVETMRRRPSYQS